MRQYPRMAKPAQIERIQQLRNTLRDEHGLRFSLPMFDQMTELQAAQVTAMLFRRLQRAQREGDEQ